MRSFISCFTFCALAYTPASTLAFQLTSSHERASTSLHDSRREALVSTAGLIGLLVGNAPAAQADTGADVRGIGVTPFNSLMFQYRGSESANGGVLKSSDIDEPTIPYAEFCEKLKTGDVKFVEFMAPDGDAAYATIEGSEKPIRVGEGYPVEQHDGWSSPAFAIRTVQNAKVPYKFTVPALSTYKN